MKAKNHTETKRRAVRAASFVFALFFILSAMAAATPALAISSRDAATPEDVGLATDHLTAAFLYNIENEFTVMSYNANEMIFPASTVKIMTGLIAIEKLGRRLNDEVTVTKEMLEGAEGNKIGFKEGEILTIENLLYSLLVGGGNDAAHILATVIAGSVSDFVAMMNARAKELGATNTIYTNPSGVHDDAMITTAADTAKIALAAYKLPLFMEMTSTSKYVIPETNMSEYRNVFNRNYMISTSSVIKYFYTDAAGMNSGATNQGGYCVVTTASREGLTYLAIVMGADVDEEKDSIYSYTEASKMLDFAFKSYANVTVVKAGEIIREIPVTLSGTTDFVTLVTSDSLTLYLPVKTDLDTEIKQTFKTVSDSLTAPVAQGEVAGVLTVTYNDEIVGNVDLVTTVDVARSEFLYTLEQIKSFATGRFFISVVISAVIFTVLFVIIKAVYLHHKTKYRGRYS